MLKINYGDIIFIKLDPSSEIDAFLMEKYPNNIKKINDTVYLADTVKWIYEKRNMLQPELHPYGFERSNILTAAEFKKLNHSTSELAKFLDKTIDQLDR